MAAGKSIADILAGAKETLAHADDLSKGTSAEVAKVGPKPAPLPSVAPKHEFSNASYSLAKEANDAGKGVKARMDMETKARQALQ